jgi:hypothetical protein
MATWGSLVGWAMIAIGCGGSPKGAASAPNAEGAAAATNGDAGGAVLATADASAPSATPPASAPGATATDATPAAPPPPAHPFANNAVEATSLIDDAINSRANELGQCVDAARTRRKEAHARLVLEVGIDEEGHMLGVKLPKGEKADKTLVDCVLAALRGAPFPKSHAGVITVRKTFEDKAVYR